MNNSDEAEQLDVLIIGAGISGIGAGRYLKVHRPGTTFAILESRDSSGGTWDLFRYPGIRSDSDLHTFGYSFKPWRDGDAIADGAKIVDYIRQAASENDLDSMIRYQHRVTSAAWSSAQGRWLVESLTPEGPRQFSARWVFAATGYYNYDEGYTPVFAGRERFAGPIVHPQHWPEDLDYSGKNVVVIGSGATAVTLLPAMLEGPNAAARVTMLQRTPTYVMPVPKRDKIAIALNKILGQERGYALTRRKNIARQRFQWKFAQDHPRITRRVIRMVNRRALPDGFDVDQHFNPPYDPWDQRVCAVPDADLFKAIRRGTADVVTGRIETFTETGVKLTNGQEVEADIIVTATGLNLQLLGGMQVSVDGEAVHFPDRVAYRGMMLSGIPNLAFAVGYTNSSWTLKVDLLCEYFIRLLDEMDAHGYDVACPQVDPTMPTRPLLDFDAGYVQRSLAELPRQGESAPWRMSMSFYEDRKLLRSKDIADPALHFSSLASFTEAPALT